MHANSSPRSPRSGDATDREPPYGRYAFLNPYNLSLFVGLVLLGLFTGHHWIVIVASAAELMWLIFAPDSKLLRRVWFDPVFLRAERAFADERCKQKLATMCGPDQLRVMQLTAQKTTIERLARDNHSLAVDLLHDELAKLQTLIEEFVDLGVSAGRAEQHAQTFDFVAMRRSWLVHEEQTKRHRRGDPRREVAEKNLAVLEQRRARYDDLTRTIQVARGQMELIEQTFRLLGDEILTMGSPRELGGRIDELRIAVDAVRETAEQTFAYCEEESLRHEERG